MATKPIKESVLLKTSSASDVQNSAGVLSITGLRPVSKRNISAIKQIKYRAEVAQVVTVSTTAAPTASTTYAIAVYDELRQQAGYEESPKIYKYTTTSNFSLEGATDALRREYINSQLVTKINADATNHVTAASLGTGTGLTITDNGSYYPVFAQNMTNMKGISNVYTITNPDGSGFASNLASVTTAGVYSFGVGANLLAEKPVVDFVYGNLISGVIDDAPVTFANPPAGAVSGQNYDGFTIESLHPVDAIGVTGQYAYVERIQRIFVDNGTGSSTTNLTGFGTFEKLMLRQIAQLYSKDLNGFAEFFDNRPLFSGIGTAGIPTGSDGDINQLATKDWSWPYYIKGASTQIFPLWDATNGSGLILDLDNAAEGLEIATQPLGTASQEFIVGKTAFSLYYKGTITDVSQANPFYVGFRKKQAFNTAISGYTDYAALGFNASAVTQTIKVMTNLASAGEVSTSSAKTWADAATHVFEIRVDFDGSVKFLVDSVDVTSVQATAYSFTAGLTVIPFVRAIGTGGGAPTNTANAWIVLGDNTWRQ